VYEKDIHARAAVVADEHLCHTIHVSEHFKCRTQEEFVHVLTVHSCWHRALGVGRQIKRLLVRVQLK